MLESFTLIGTQVFILFILIAIGYMCGKLKILTENGVRSVTDLMLYIVTPAVIINAFQREYSPELFTNLMRSILAATITHVVAISLGLIFIRKYPDEKRRVYRFASVYSNCGFMAFPLLEALLGSEGVFYGTGYLVTMNTIMWSYGQYTMAKGKKGFSVKAAFINPTNVAIVLGLIFFFTSTKLPEIIGEPIKYLSGLNTPVPMLIIGYTIASTNLKGLIKDIGILKSVALRNIITPLIMLGILYFMNYRGTLFIAAVISACCPVAAATTMFSIKFDCDAPLASKILAVSTLASIATMSLIVGLAQTLS